MIGNTELADVLLGIARTLGLSGVTSQYERDQQLPYLKDGVVRNLNGYEAPVNDTDVSSWQAVQIAIASDHDRQKASE